ncbi:ubiquitin-conjugating enzyme E2-binding protein [Cladorrhinum sp. PSN259]|nr:ubiquitin-conjugating enzyme E2-binding protein [Cladorrhinum sp. PSN259]
MNMAPSNGCSLYAELLPNIRQITFVASLPGPSDASTRLVIHANGVTAELRYRDEAHTLSLPSRVALGGKVVPIDQRQINTTSLLWRLPLDISVAKQSWGSDPNTAVWSATDFAAGSEVSCRKCNTVLVGAGVAAVWKDLPSENWAEMMEFWHCHKPADHPHHGHDHSLDSNHKDAPEKADEQSLAARGYGASSIVSAQEGVGFVDLTTLMFTESDCQNLVFSSAGSDDALPNIQNLTLTDKNGSVNRSLNVFCSSCHTQLGFYLFISAGVTLHKWQVSCKSKSGVSPGIPECLASTITSTTARSGSSKSLIMPINEITTQTDTETKHIAIHIWVMNATMAYSSSKITQRSIPAIKLFYRFVTREEADKMLEKVTQDAQEINLPPRAIDEIVRHLEASNSLLPITERVFNKEWKVGLLTR